MKQILKNILIKIRLHKPLLYLDPRKNSLSIVRGKIKQFIVKKYALKFNCRILVETGTYKGDMVQATKKLFSRVYSVELSPELFTKAKKRFLDDENVVLSCGDSGLILKGIISSINEPILFWLDAHYSKANTAQGNKDTPIIQELETIISHGVKNHVILIDDARLFNGTCDYPTINEIDALLKEKADQYSMEVTNDIIRITSTQKTN